MSTPATAAITPSSRLFVGNLPYRATEADLLGCCRGLALEPLCARLPLDPEGKARGFAFVDFGTPVQAAAAMSAMRGAELMGRRLVVDFAKPAPPPFRTRRRA